MRRFVKTEMGNACAKSIGLEEAFAEPKECAEALVKLVSLYSYLYFLYIGV